MPANSIVVETFYKAFQSRDYNKMNAQYATDIVFSDPVFMVLHGDDVRDMWEMLCRNAKDFSLTFSEVTELDEEYVTCRWTASYTFSKTGKKVVNNVKAYMKLRDGKITEHSDAFRLSTWIGQAIGWKGVMFGWTGFMKRAVQKNARKSLAIFQSKKKQEVH